MDFINEQLLEYCERLSEPESDLLKWLNRETHLKVSQSRMLSGHLQGRLLSFLSKLVRPASILEIGTYTGYSALCLAEGLQENGRLITIDPNEETNLFARRAFESSAAAAQITQLSGHAQELLPTLPGMFDLVFIDADKKNYGLYFDLVIDKVRSGGLIIADNVLWSGKVIDDQPDKDTVLILDFNQKIKADPRIRQLIVPVRDGLTLMLKI